MRVTVFTAKLVVLIQIWSRFRQVNIPFQSYDQSILTKRFLQPYYIWWSFFYQIQTGTRTEYNTKATECLHAVRFLRQRTTYNYDSFQNDDRNYNYFCGHISKMFSVYLRFTYDKLHVFFSNVLHLRFSRFSRCEKYMWISKWSELRCCHERKLGNYQYYSVHRNTLSNAWWNNCSKMCIFASRLHNLHILCTLLLYILREFLKLFVE